MAAIGNIEHFAEIEYCTNHYLFGNIIPIMDDVQSFLSNKQAEEIKEYNSSLGGILSSMASAAHPGVDTSMQILKATGEWNSKTAEDYVQMCRDKVKSDPKIIHDLQVLTDEWRKAIIDEIGQERYVAASNTLGCDLAAAYVDYRVEQKMIDHMVDKNMPKSTAEYIIRKGASESLFGLGQTLMRSPLEAEIIRQGEEKFNPGTGAKIGSRALSFAFDTVGTGGFGSWSGLVKLAGVEVAFAGVEAYMDHKNKGQKQMTIEECISQGVFGNKDNVFTQFKAKSTWIPADESVTIKNINSKLNHKVGTFNLFGYLNKGAGAVFSPVKDFIKGMEKNFQAAMQIHEHSAQQASAQSEQQPEQKSESQATQVEIPEESTDIDESSETDQMQEEQQNRQQNQQQEQNPQSQSANQDGWGQLMGEMGFDGLGDIGKNLGYVIAMMPDIIVGMMTGKTESIHLRNNLVPIASVVAGLFIKNPILKMLLIGMGGMNLINKAGHEQIDRHNNPDGIRFKQYADEELNPRIVNPAISGNSLVATIDRTPCTITLPDNVVAAYQAGALPINTLANAILARHEANSRMAQNNYEEAANQNLARNLQLK